MGRAEKAVGQSLADKSLASTSCQDERAEQLHQTVAHLGGPLPV